MQNFGGLQAVFLRYESQLPNWNHLSYVKAFLSVSCKHREISVVTFCSFLCLCLCEPSFRRAWPV